MGFLSCTNSLHTLSPSSGRVERKPTADTPLSPPAKRFSRGEQLAYAGKARRHGYGDQYRLSQPGGVQGKSNGLLSPTCWCPDGWARRGSSSCWSGFFFLRELRHSTPFSLTWCDLVEPGFSACFGQVLSRMKDPFLKPFPVVPFRRSLSLSLALLPPNVFFSVSLRCRARCK